MGAEGSAPGHPGGNPPRIGTGHAIYAVSGLFAHSLGWRAALYVAGAPGLLLCVLALWLPEPARGSAETHTEIEEKPPTLPEADQRESAVLAVLRIPTMRWIIVSGALFNL